MANDAISAALAKGEAKYQNLQAKTMPFYEKMQQGKFSKADMKKLKSLYLEQSKTAAKAFEESSKAVEKNAKIASRSIVSKAVSNKQLLNAKELNVIINSAFSKAFQKSADQIKQVVDESLQGQLDDIKAILLAIQASTLSDHEVIAHIREQLLPSFASLAQIENPDFETLLDPRVRRRFLKKREKTLADEIVTRTVKAIISYDKLKEQERLGQFRKRDTKWYNPFSKISETAKSLKDLYRRQRFERQYGKLDVTEEIDDVYRSMTPKQNKLKKFIGQVSALKQFTQSVLFNLSQYDFNTGEIRSSRLGNERMRAYAGAGYMRSAPAENTSLVSKIAAFYTYPYKKVKNSRLGQYLKEELNQKLPRREKFSIENTTHSLVKFLKLDEWTQTLSLLKKNFLYHLSPWFNSKDDIYKAAKEKFVARIREKYKDQSDKVDQFLDRLDDIERNRYNTPQSERAFTKMRSLILKDVKSQWFVNIKHTANRYYQAAKKKLTKSQSFDKAKKVLKTIGYMYLASVIINMLNAVFPTWRESLISAIGKGLEVGIKYGIPAILGAIPAIILTTGKFLIENADSIASITLKIVAAIGESIIKAFLSLLFGDKAKDPEHLQDPEQQKRQAIFKDPEVQKIMKEHGLTRSNVNNALSNNHYVRENEEKNLTQKQLEGIAKIQKMTGLGNAEAIVVGPLYKPTQAAKDAINKTKENVEATVKPVVDKVSEYVPIISTNVSNDQQKAQDAQTNSKLAKTSVTMSPPERQEQQNINVSGTSNAGQNKGTTSATQMDTNKSSPDLDVINGGLLFNDA